MSELQTYSLRLPRSLKSAVERLARSDGISVNQFITLAVAEKISALDTESFFREWRERADIDAFDRIMNRTGGEAPREGDEIPQEGETMRSLARYDAIVRMQDSSKGELALYFPREMAEAAGWTNGGEIILRFSDRPEERWRARVTTCSSHIPYVRTNVYAADTGAKRPLSELMRLSRLEARDRVPCVIEDQGDVLLQVENKRIR